MNSHLQEIEHIHRKSFDYLARNPDAWLRTAESLKRAADALRDHCWPKQTQDYTDAAAVDHELGLVYMLLVGFGVENIIKGIIVATDPDVVQSQKLAKGITSHDLIKLYEQAKLRRCETFERLLIRLQAVITAFGRYPVSATKKDMDKKVGVGFHSAPDFENMQRLWGYVVEQLRQKRAQS